MTPYTSHADLGGQLGHGAVLPAAEGQSAGELWHAPWESRAMALTLAMGATGAWNLDASRAARETLPGYAGLSYYEIWVAGLQRLLQARGLLHDDEITQGQALHPAPPLPRKLLAAQVAVVLAQGASTSRQATAPARYAVGDTVRMKATPAPHHTRLPGYVRGKQGVVTALHGCHVYPDSHARGAGEQPCWLYTVAFTGTALWGSEPSATGLCVSVDAWETYLEPA